ncbi:MAG: alpha/beta hydrolase [Bacteroidota bacterium]
MGNIFESSYKSVSQTKIFHFHYLLILFLVMSLKRINLKFLPLLLLLLSVEAFAQNDGENISLHTETGKIEGTLLCPETSEKIPLALIIAGSGPTDRDGNNPMMKNNSLKMLAEGLAKHEIASVRYDKRGIAKSADAAVDERALRFEHYVDDVKDWIDTLKKDPRFSELIIIGHSEGSTIGMIASQSEKVDKFVSIAGPGDKAAVILKTQLSKQAPDMMDQILPIFEKLEKGDLVEEVPPMLNMVFRPSVQPYLISWFKYDPRQEIAKLTIPIMVIQGTTDIQVNLSDAERLTAANKKAILKKYEGMNHILKEAEMDQFKNIKTYNDPDLPLKDGLVLNLAEFIHLKS